MKLLEALNAKNYSRSKQHGFSLIELLLVISLILIIGTFSAGFYSRFLLQNTVANTTDQIVMQLRKAQIYSMTGKQNRNWGVKYAGNTLTLFAIGTTAFDEKTTINSNTTITGLTQITFTKATGVPDLAPSITISSSNNTRTISVSIQGAISRIN